MVSSFSGVDRTQEGVIAGGRFLLPARQASGEVVTPPSSATPSQRPSDKALRAEARQVRAPGPDELLKTLGIRIGLPMLGGWLIVLFVNNTYVYVVAGIVTIAAAGLALWAWRRVQSSRQVVDILQSAKIDTKEGREAALSKLEDFKDGGIAATFAKAQLLLQDNPDKALEVLESIDLTKVLPPEADQARSQRAMIYLARGDVERARPLIDAIELGRHEEPKTRAMLAAVMAEGWARSGQAKKALETLDLFNADEDLFSDIRPQLWRARAFAAASLNDRKEMKRALKKLMNDNPQYLTGFLVKKIHPLLEKDARDMLMQSGAVQRPKQQFRRM
ncbi:MAG: hypothetical protein U0165_05845 [Polyangiaceae bacterium]